MYVLKSDLHNTLKEEEAEATTPISRDTNNCRGFVFLAAVILKEKELCDSLRCYPPRTRSPGEAKHSGAGPEAARGAAGSCAELCRAEPGHLAFSCAGRGVPVRRATPGATGGSWW